MPIERLDEKPTREATLVDITCDSEGEVRKFIDLEDVRDTLPLHELVKDSATGKTDPYRLGFFLMGAYQDIMGDLHNLFGRVNEAHVSIPMSQLATTLRKSSVEVKSSIPWRRFNTIRTR